MVGVRKDGDGQPQYEKIPASRVVDLFLEPIVPLQEVEGNQMVPYQEHGPADVDEQGLGTADGVNWAEKYRPTTVDGPPDVEEHGSSDVN
ncbi:hypothetical protein Q3G72_012043 [Acer saccharum]|nr:hypothetical protein Q3G72_012043 [Acer saccharum]